VIACTRCGKDNQDHYKFCLGCGAKLERAAAPAASPPAPVAMPSVSIGTASTAPPVAASPGSKLAAIALAKVPANEATPAPLSRPHTAVAPVAATSAPIRQSIPAAAAPAESACPKCGNGIKANNTFCGKCGFRLKVAQSSPAIAPAPGFASGDSSGSVPRTMYMAPPQQVAKAPAHHGHLTLIRPDGTEGGIHPLVEGENLIGRGQGSLFDADPYLSPRHAEFQLDDNGLTVRDLKSLNGVFFRLTQEEALDSGHIFRIGQELLRFDVISEPMPLEDGTEIIGTPNPGYWGRISVIVGRDVDGPAFPIFEEAIVLGRERGDILFPEDGYVSATHARISLRDGHVYLQDLGSSNGSFLRINGERQVDQGCLLLMGQQLFRVQFV